MRRDKLGRVITEAYSEEFRHKVVEEYLTTGRPKLIIQKKYGIRFTSAICTWMKKLGYEDIHAKRAYFAFKDRKQLRQQFTMPEKDKQQQPDKASLEKRIKELEKELQDEKLRSEAYKLTIEIAERELNIPIRKK
jgi:transposase